MWCVLEVKEEGTFGFFAVLACLNLIACTCFLGKVLGKEQPPQNSDKNVKTQAIKLKAQAIKVKNHAKKLKVSAN